MLALTRTVLAVRASGAPAIEYPRQIARLSLEGVVVGQKYHSRQHLADVEYLAARCLLQYLVEEMREVAPGLGIPPALHCPPMVCPWAGPVRIRAMGK